MIRFLFAIFAAFAVAGLVPADPIKKASTDADKLAKECADAFVKAILEAKADDALKLCATPFRDPEEGKLDNLDKLKRDIERPTQARIEVKVGDPVELSKLNAFLKKKDIKELDNATIEEYRGYVGKEGRIVMLELKGDGAPRSVYPPHLLIRVKDGKAHIVGLVRG